MTTGTIDAWAEALSVGAHGAGDLMLMYGTTMFLVHTTAEHLTWPGLWGDGRRGARHLQPGRAAWRPRARSPRG
ncbi:hypothetical protein ACFSTC_21790 [Nonomuraea ferruginea]